MRELSQIARRQTEVIRKNLMDRRSQLMRVYGEYNLSAEKARSLNREINDLQSRLLDVNLDSQLVVRRILDREQFANFAQLMRRQGAGRDPDDEIEGGKEIPFGPKRGGGLGPPRPRHGDTERIRQRIKQPPWAAVQTIRAKRAALEALYQYYDLDEQKARAIVRDLNNAQMQLLETRLHLQIELRHNLTEDQFNRLRDRMADKMKREGPRQRRSGSDLRFRDVSPR